MHYPGVNPAPNTKAYLRKGTLPTPGGRDIPNKISVKPVSIRPASTICVFRKDSKE